MEGLAGVDRTSERHHMLPKSTFSAYSESQKQHGMTAKQLHTVKVALVCTDSLLIGLQPILVFMSKNSEGKFSYNPVSINLLTEICKVVFAVCVLLFTGTGRPGPPMYRSVRSFIRDAQHNRLLMIPASLYAINNYLKFVMQLYFKPTTAKMLGNLKIFTIAILLRIVMNRSFSTIQWEALFLLVFGITINQLSNCSSGKDSDPVSLAGLLYTGGAVTIPAAASVYNELALKRHMDTSVHLQNFFLYFYGMVFNLLGLWVFMLVGHESLSSVFSGISGVAVLLVINNAAQGILSSFFYKFADTILKKYSSTLATILTGIMSAFLFGHQLTINFLIGISIVFISMHQFFTYGEKRQGKTEKGSDQLTRSKTNGGIEFIHSPSADHLQMNAPTHGSATISDRMLDGPRSKNGSLLPK
ncbi:hypothetical protein BSKO_09475 [Bryopsis sp. KO-2023]|nr:hypothetical protein BSKO_09475 [Bryopsis sp. KO-2023]